MSWVKKVTLFQQICQILAYLSTSTLSANSPAQGVFLVMGCHCFFKYQCLYHFMGTLHVTRVASRLHVCHRWCHLDGHIVTYVCCDTVK